MRALERTRSIGRELRPLWLPIYLPSLVFSAGSSVLPVVTVILALQLGAAPAQVAMILTAIGGIAILTSLVAGGLVERMGERRTIGAVTALSAAGLVLAGVMAQFQAPGALWILISALLLFDLADAVWGIARQGLIAHLAPPARLGLAMNLFGASMRVGRVGGPLIAALVIWGTGPAMALPAAAAVVLIAALLFLRAGGQIAPHSQAAPEPPQSRKQQKSTKPQGREDASAEVSAAEGPHRRSRTARILLIMGAGVFVIAMLRTSKVTLIPLWGAEAVHLDASQISVLVGIAAAMELVLFLPAGMALDRIGRRPVVVTCPGVMGLGFALTPLMASHGWLLLCAVLVGLGDGVGAGLVKTLGADLAPDANRAVFFGRWQSVGAAGAFAAPAITAGLLLVTDMGATFFVLGAAALLAAGWMAYWTPKFIPHRAR